jgi:short-subunit dehydrogenase
MSKRELTDRVIVITGASSGFGRGAALALAERGASVVVAARRGDLLDEVAHQCRTRGGRAVAVPTDVARHLHVERLAETAVGAFGHFDVWINDAGVAALGNFDEIPLADHTQVVVTNLLGVINGSWFALRHFRARGRGTLINVASALGKMPVPYYGSYVASKFGVVGLDGALRQELELAEMKAIKVCTVMPMSHDTPIFDHVANYTGHEVQPVPPLYDEQKVVDTLVRLVTDPEDEVVVGGMGKLYTAAHAMMREPMERALAKTSHRAMIEKSPPAPKTRGNIADPVPHGRGVSGGRRAASRKR